MSSGQVDPLNFPDQWYVVTIAGVPSPGVAIVSEWKRKDEWDIKKGKGTVGATVTYVGRPPATGSIEFQLWEARHFADWDLFRPMLKYDPTKKAVQAIDIYHPSLADVDISSVVVEEIGNIVHKGQGLWSITVSFLEYAPPPAKSAVSTPSGAQGSSPAGGTPGTPPAAAPDALDRSNAALLTQLQQP